RRGLRLIIEHAVLERPHVAGHVACDKRGHQGLDEGTVHGNLLEEETRDSPPARERSLVGGWAQRVRGMKRPARFPALAASKVSAAWACVGNADKHAVKRRPMARVWCAPNGTASRPLSAPGS